ncbi:hypothetical protein [Streptomyces sp. NBC_00557]|uniref:hypothetical protein n=1 Tax=Streptomyces sp. NBC_00557 TaxID=2975776 RepID=UPI002E814705|nr:hypothetical protein [Streptomyces sp. NBC_00557]WUC36986.1 hypothetical protein OG956_23620 [Streptomyces sp. NBC_00557]
MSNTLGTSSGDFLSGGLGLGFRDSSLLLCGAMLVILATHYLTPISGTVLFWAAYVLTRPLGAVVENAVEKPVTQGGLGAGTTVTSSALLAVLAILVGRQMLTDRRQTRTVDTLSPTDSHDLQPVDPSTATLSADYAGKPSRHRPKGSGRADRRAEWG